MLSWQHLSALPIAVSLIKDTEFIARFLCDLQQRQSMGPHVEPLNLSSIIFTQVLLLHYYYLSNGYSGHIYSDVQIAQG